jgi:Fur family ferric uptake transcriptional regulator
MTVAPRTQVRPVSTLEEAISAVRREGKRLTTPRRLLLEALFETHGPVSATHLAESLAVDESSVYRNLEVLERHGLVRHMHLGHGPGLYVLVRRHESEYLYCERCANVTAVAPEQLEGVRAEIRERFGFEAHFTHFALVGLCRDCGEASAAIGKPRR